MITCLTAKPLEEHIEGKIGLNYWPAKLPKVTKITHLSIVVSPDSVAIFTADVSGDHHAHHYLIMGCVK